MSKKTVALLLILFSASAFGGIKDAYLYNTGMAFQKAGLHGKAYDCFMKAADLGNAEAFCELGESFLTGSNGVQRHPRFAYDLLMGAVFCGSGDAAVYLGNKAEYDGDYEKACFYFIFARRNTKNADIRQLVEESLKSSHYTEELKLKKLKNVEIHEKNCRLLRELREKNGKENYLGWLSEIQGWAPVPQPK